MKKWEQGGGGEWQRVLLIEGEGEQREQREQEQEQERVGGIASVVVELVR